MNEDLRLERELAASIAALSASESIGAPVQDDAQARTPLDSAPFSPKPEPLKKKRAPLSQRLDAIDSSRAAGSGKTTSRFKLQAA